MTDWMLIYVVSQEIHRNASSILVFGALSRLTVGLPPI